MKSTPTAKHALRVRRMRHSRPFQLLLSLVLLAMLGGIAQQAVAFTPATIAPDAGVKPAINVTVTHGAGAPSGKADPLPGDTFTYTYKFALTNMTEAGTTNKLVLTVNADANAPWTATPTAANFTGPGGLGTPTLSNCNTTTCTVTYTNVKVDGTITFTPQAKVNSPLANAVPIVATAQASVSTTPTVSLAPVTSTFVGDNGGAFDCSGTFTFSQKLSGGGAWLLDIHFADGNGQGKVQLDANAQLYPYNAAPAGNKNTIKVVDASGNDITAAVFAKATYLAPDPTKPYFPGDAIQTQYPNARWLDSLNWKWDPSTFTGDTWLPAGSTVTVTRHVTNANCAPGGFTTDWTTDRPFGMSMEIARPITKADGFGMDEFSTPGVPVATTCSNIYRSTTTNSGKIFLWNPVNNSNSLVYAPGGEVSGLAISPKYPERIYYYSSTAGFAYRDTANSTNGTLVPPAGVSSTNEMAFGPDGTLWMLGNNGNLYSLAHADLGTGGSKWVDHGLILYSGVQGDLVLDAAGNMYILDSFSSVRLYTITAAELQKTSGITMTTQTITGLPSPSVGYSVGLAYGGDGKLYLSNGNLSGSVSYMYVLDPATAKATNQVSVTGNTDADRKTQDMASCSFGVPPTTGPKFKWQKSVVNPDGSVAPAGTTGVTRQVNPDGTITVRYLITVANVGTAAGTSPTITDNVRVPSGFTITDVALDGVSKGAVNSFTIPGVNLDPTNGGGTSVTYVVTVQAKATLNTMTAAQWTEAGTCNTTNAGTPTDGGFFNTAAFQASDSDGANNNDACTPVTPPISGSAQLALIKKIVDGAGNEIAGSVDSKYFTLIAGGPTGVTGSSATSGAIAADQKVLPGTYTLSERGNDGGSTSGTYTQGTWTCVNRANNNAPFTVTNDQITLVNGSNVACTITNTRNPKVHVVKEAATPDSTLNNSHIGATITPSADGTFTANYKITVTNTSNFVGDTGPINDYYTVPAGLLWDGTKTATLTYVPGSVTGTSLVPAPASPWTATEAQLRNGFTLARSIQNIPAGASVSFTISIPLKTDQTVASGQTKSNFELNSGNLATCTNSASAAGNAYTDTTKGIPNVVSLTGEDLTYNDVPIKDNVACIPVRLPVPVYPAVGGLGFLPYALAGMLVIGGAAFVRRRRGVAMN